MRDVYFCASGGLIAALPSSEQYAQSILLVPGRPTIRTPAFVVQNDPCWLVAPLGPYVNYVSGLTSFSWPRFALWGMAGEVVWVGLYVGLGFLFADNITAISALLSSISGFLVAFVVAVGLGFWLVHVSKARERKRAAQ